MGRSSDWAIEEANFLYETDEDYRRSYDEQMAIDAALEAEFFAQEIENEKQVDWFDDKLIDFRGEPVELPEPIREAAYPIDDDLPF